MGRNSWALGGWEGEESSQDEEGARGRGTPRCARSSVLHSALPTSNHLQQTMSCGMIHTTDNYFSSSNWITRSESSESLSRLDLVSPHQCPSEPMMTLEDLRSQYNSCYTCGVSWSDNHVSLDCGECGGYSLERPCPLCDGKCRMAWRRDISMSHSVGKAHWEGECALSVNDRPAVPAFLAEDVLVQGLEDLSTSS